MHNAEVFHLSMMVASDHLDGLGHVNNVQYLRWAEDVAWAHSEQLGLGLAQFVALDYAMVARQHLLNYKAACFFGQHLQLTTWLGARNPLKMTRHYAFYRQDDGVLVFDGHTDWVCVRLSTGRPQRMPAEFRRAYGLD